MSFVRLLGHGLMKAFKTIYNLRSQALHAGIPFPAPICMRPRKMEALDPVEEQPCSLGTSMRSAVWFSDDLPMHLHIFEYIVCNALIKWIFQIKITDGQWSEG